MADARIVVACSVALVAIGSSIPSRQYISGTNATQASLKDSLQGSSLNCRRWKVDAVRIVAGVYSNFEQPANKVLGVTFWYRDGKTETWGVTHAPLLSGGKKPIRESTLWLAWDEVLTRAESFVHDGTTRGLGFVTNKGNRAFAGFRYFKHKSQSYLSGFSGTEQVCPSVALDVSVMESTPDNPIVRILPSSLGDFQPAKMPDQRPAKDCSCELQYFCPSTHKQANGEFQNIYGLTAINGHGGGGQVEHCDVCAAKCQNQAECRAYECAQTNRQCWLSRSPTPTSPKVGDFTFCSNSRPYCASGYIQATGELQNIFGLTAINGKGGGEAIGCQACAEQCNSEEECAAYECSETNWQCWLSRSAMPTVASPKVGDFFFCAKP